MSSGNKNHSLGSECYHWSLLPQFISEVPSLRQNLSSNSLLCQCFILKRVCFPKAPVLWLERALCVPDRFPEPLHQLSSVQFSAKLKAPAFSDELN